MPAPIDLLKETYVDHRSTCVDKLFCTYRLEEGNGGLGVPTSRQFYQQEGTVMCINGGWNALAGKEAKCANWGETREDNYAN